MFGFGSEAAPSTTWRWILPAVAVSRGEGRRRVIGPRRRRVEAGPAILDGDGSGELRHSAACFGERKGARACDSCLNRGGATRAWRARQGGCDGGVEVGSGSDGGLGGRAAGAGWAGAGQAGFWWAATVSRPGKERRGEGKEGAGPEGSGAHVARGLLFFF